MLKVKVLYVIANSSFGGGEKSFAELIKGLGDDFDIYSACGLGEPFCGQVNEKKSFFVDFSNQCNVFNVFALAKIIKKYSIDIVHSQGARVDFYAALASKLAGAKHISTVAMPVDGFNVGFLKKAAYLFLSKLGERITGRFIVVSEALKKTMIEKHGAVLEKVTVIPNGVNSNLFKKIGAGEASSSKYGKLGKRTVGCAARLVWQKGLEYLIDAVDIISRKSPEISTDLICVIGGKGELECQLKTKVKSKGLEKNILFPGFIDDMEDFLEAIDVFVMPSLLEGQPIALLEAMAKGKAVIAANIDGVRETLTDGYDGLLIPPENSSALAAAIIELFRNQEKRVRLGLNAKKTVESKYNMDIFIKKHKQVYMEFFKDR